MMKTIWMSVADDAGTVTAPPKADVVEKTPMPPRNYTVTLLHDDYTNPLFVYAALLCHFNKSSDEAGRLAQRFKNRESIVVGCYPEDIADTRAQQTQACARKKEYPLLAKVEPTH